MRRFGCEAAAKILPSYLVLFFPRNIVLFPDPPCITTAHRLGVCDTAQRISQVPHASNITKPPHLKLTLKPSAARPSTP